MTLSISNTCKTQISKQFLKH